MDLRQDNWRSAFSGAGAVGRWSVLLVAVMLVAVPALSGCGRFRSSDGGGGALASGGVPDFLSSPPLLSPVPIGSLDVAATPPPGAVGAALLLRLGTEPGAKVVYSFREFQDDAPLASLKTYEQALSLWAPVTVWAQAVAEDGSRGEVREFAYTEDESLLPALEAFPVRRLPAPGGVTVLPSVKAVSFAAQGANDDGDAKAFDPTLDGGAAEWSATARAVTRDGRGDVPAGFGVVDLDWSGAVATPEALWIALATVDAPESADASTAVIYGLDVGTSGVSFETFGSGATFPYRIEVIGGVLTVTTREKGKAVPISKASGAAVGDVVEVRLAWADLPDLPGLGDARQLVVRPYTIALAREVTVSDRMESQYVRSDFALVRSEVPRPGSDERGWQVDLQLKPELATTAVVSRYLTPAAAFLPELERANTIRLTPLGTLPLFLVEKEVSGYAGLNTSDRGVMTTIGPGAGALSRAQIVAHELAHLQNARNSQLTPRWLQEGMSEWTAERLLYKHFPPRAVHRFLRTLRFDRYFDAAGEEGDDFPLDGWGTAPSDLGYVKSLMAIDLLEARVGQAALLKAFRQAVNDPMDSAAFQSFLEAEAGESLSELFSFWVYEGTPTAANGPTLFTDADQDGLLALDEEILGTDAALRDTDGDGFGDGEEYFAGTDPLESSLALGSVPVLAPIDPQDGGSLLRLGGTPGGDYQWSLNPFDAAPSTPFQGAVLLRPPYRVAARRADSATVVTLERPLVVAGEVVPVEYSERLILPDSVRTSTSFAAGRKAGVGAGRGSEGDLALGDSAADMPEALSAYDLREVTATLGSDGRLAIRLATRTAPDRFGEFGDYVVTLDDVAWTTAGPTATRHGTLTISGGAVFWQKANPGGVETAALVHEGIDVVYEESALVVTMAASFLTSWTEASGDLVAHAYSQATLEGGARARDHGGYVTLASPGFSRAAGSVPAAFGTGRHVLEVFVEEDGATEARADGLLALGLTAIRGFETALGRPLLEREHWPVHVFYGAPSTPTVASAATRVGAWVAGDGAALEGRALDYLFVEQLARLVVADLLDRGTGAPFWIQEAFVQWLTASSLSTFYPTKDVHEFHLGRIDDYVCFVDDQAGCEDVFSADVPLSQWNVTTLSSTGSVKSLLLALRLDALLGADAMAQVFGTFANGLPDAYTLKALLSGYAPDQAARDEILALWPHWIDGSGSSSADQAAIRALLDDDDLDGLMVFEEARFGTSDSAHNGYYP